jgi:DNA-binding transcriptional MerR regulator
MKTKELADWLGLADSTVRVWSRDEFKPYLSATAKGGEGRTRHFNDLDARIIAMIAVLKNEGNSSDDIHRVLQQLQKQDWQDLPPMPPGPPDAGPIAMMPREVAETAVSTQRAALMREISLLQDRVDILSEQLTTEREKRDEVQRDLLETKERLGELRGQVSEAGSKQELLERERNRERRLLTSILIVVGIVALALLVVVVFLAVSSGTVG